LDGCSKNLYSFLFYTGSHLNITSIRINDCAIEPCTVKKGVHHPVELDFIFEKPLETDLIHFTVFISYWVESDTSVYGSHLAVQHNCSELGIRTCPAKAGVPYTLKSAIFIPLASKDSINGNKTAVGYTATFRQFRFRFLLLFFLNNLQV